MIMGSRNLISLNRKSAREWASLEVLVSLPAFAVTWTRAGEDHISTDGSSDASYRVILHEKDGTVSS